MVTIDLTTQRTPAATLLEGLPRRIALTLEELRHAARLAGGAPLPFDISASFEADGLSGRLGQTRGASDDTAYHSALAGLHDPGDTLRRRGLLIDDNNLDPHLAGAIGLLATPQLALEIDIATDNAQVKAWHRQADGAVATLATCDGVVFELTWFPQEQWASELARVAVLPEDLDLRPSAVPEFVDFPFQALDAAGEAIRSSRGELVSTLLQQSAQPVLGVDGPVPSANATSVATAFHREGAGRLRVLAARVAERETTDIGVVSWVLLRDGWHSLVAHTVDDEPRMSVRRVQPDDLASELAPVLAQVIA